LALLYCFLATATKLWNKKLAGTSRGEDRREARNTLVSRVEQARAKGLLERDASRRAKDTDLDPLPGRARPDRE
jgi:hypothetical protein